MEAKTVRLVVVGDGAVVGTKALLNYKVIRDHCFFKNTG